MLVDLSKNGGKISYVTKNRLSKHAILYQNATFSDFRAAAIGLCRANPPMFLEIPVEIAWVFVSKQQRHFLERNFIFQQEFPGQLLALFSQVVFWRFAHVFLKMPLQCAHGNALLFRQRGSAPVGLAREFRPVLNLIQSAGQRRDSAGRR